jgi:hypothetical protein
VGREQVRSEEEIQYMEQIRSGQGVEKEWRRSGEGVVEEWWRSS